MVRQTLWLAAVFLAVILLAGCVPDIRAQNQIGPAELTSDQQEIVDLLGFGTQNIMLFDFSTNEPFTTIELWVEALEYGELVDQPVGIHMGNPNAGSLEGRMAVIVDHDTQDSSFRWTVIVDDGGGRGRSVSESVAVGEDLLRASLGPEMDPVTIQDGKEIILNISKFHSGGVSMFSDRQIYLEQPELLKEYPYVHIIKARFSS